MDTETFNSVIDKQVTRCLDMLSVKANEYATHDRLHNFRTAAKIQSCGTKQALAGMMAKHTVSIYDMCATDLEGDNETAYSIDMWNEKITDSINYLLLLRAIVEETTKTN